MLNDFDWSKESKLSVDWWKAFHFKKVKMASRLAVLVLALSDFVKAAAPRPHILLVLFDDFGW